MMDQRQQRISGTKLQRRFWQGSKREPIDHDGAAFGNGEEACLCSRARGFARQRKTVAKIDDIDPPAEATKLRDHPTVVGVTAGWDRQIARHREREAFHHRSASYQARAICDSESVPRIALRARPSRPSWPARAASASRSKICLVRNSVVVLEPLSSGSSSRLR